MIKKESDSEVGANLEKCQRCAFTLRWASNKKLKTNTPPGNRQTTRKQREIRTEGGKARSPS